MNDKNKKQIIIDKNNNQEVLIKWADKPDSLIKIILNNSEKENFDDFYDSIINELSNNVEIEIVLEESKNFDLDSQIDTFICGFKEVLEKEIENIAEDIKKLD